MNLLRLIVRLLCTGKAKSSLEVLADLKRTQRNNGEVLTVSHSNHPTYSDEKEMLEYRETIRHLANTKSSAVFHNASPDHASLVVAELIKQARRRIYIYEKDLDGELANRNPDIEKFLRDRADDNTEIRIVFLNSASNSTSILETLRELSKKNKHVQVRLASPSFSKAVTSKFTGLTQFAVADGVGFRIEVDGDRRALCSFNQPEFASSLDRLFDDNFGSCKEYVYH